MLRRSRCLLVALVMVTLASGLRGQANSTTATALPPELQAELDALQATAWHPSATLRASVGWRDNVLLSPFAPLERPFGRAELETILLRPMRNRWELVSFLNGDVLRYISPPRETGGEQQWSLHADARWQPIRPVRLSLKSTGYLRDMVIDLSETEAIRVVAPTRVRGGYVAGVTRVTLPGGFTFEPLAQIKRTDYRDYPGDSEETRAGGRLEWRRSGAFGLSAAWFEQRRRYSQRTQFTAGGRPLPGTRLRFHQRDGELKARSAFAAAGEWTLALSAGWLENRDGASGYFDYDQQRARLEVEWQRGPWRVMLDADAKRMDYLAQTVGTGIAPPARIADDYELLLRVDRELDSRWTVFGEHRWERGRSNELEFNYRANSMLAGVEWSF